MKSSVTAIIFLLFSLQVNAQNTDERTRFTCQEVQHMLPDAVQSNAIVLEQADGNAVDFMKAMLNSEAGFVLKYFRGKSGEKNLSEILKSTPDIYKGKAENMLSDTLFFDGNKVDENGNLGTDAKTFVIFFSHNNRGQYSTPKSPGFVQFKCGKPEYFKFNDQTPENSANDEMPIETDL